MTYEEAVSYIMELPKFTKKNGPVHTSELMKRLGNPQDSFSVIHVAGSNGKGSVCAFIERGLRENNIFTGLFTSPHLMDLRERFLLAGKVTSPGQFLDAERAVRRTADEMVAEGLSHPSFFEYLFAVGMVIFREAGVTIAVLETGLGGRLDATNVVKKPLITVITSISLEHTQYLGDTIEEIAAEKAGIIKEGVPLVFDAGSPKAAKIIRKVAVDRHAPVRAISTENIKNLLNTGKSIDFYLETGYDSTRLKIPFQAVYQAVNAALAYEALRWITPGLSLEDEAVRRGFEHAEWPGRMEEVLPEVYLDGAHNPDGIRAFLEAVRSLSKETSILLFSMVQDKNWEEAVRLLSSSGCFSQIILTEISDTPRALPAECLAALFMKETDYVTEVLCIENPQEAFSEGMARRKPGQKLFCAGSLYLVGELKRITGGFQND